MTVLAHKFASAFTSESELKNAILVAFLSSAFLHSQGQKLPSLPRSPISASPPIADWSRTSR